MIWPSKLESAEYMRIFLLHKVFGSEIKRVEISAAAGCAAFLFTFAVEVNFDR